MIRKHWWILALISILFAVLCFGTLKCSEKCESQGSFTQTFGVKPDHSWAEVAVSTILTADTEEAIRAYFLISLQPDDPAAIRYKIICYRLGNEIVVAERFGFKNKPLITTRFFEAARLPSAVQRDAMTRLRVEQLVERR